MPGAGAIHPINGEELAAPHLDQSDETDREADLAVVDAIATVVAEQRSETTTEHLRRIRASLTAYHRRTGPQPLGD